MKPGISVVIPGFNEEKYARNVFSGLRSQTSGNFEIIFVDGGSTDRTRDIAKRYGKVITERRKGISLARNIGARHAKGDIILFTNADTKASKNLLGIYMDLFKDKRVVAATGPLVPLEKTTPFIRFGYWFASEILAKIAFSIGKPSISGSNLAVRKSAFKRCGGFDERLVTYEDLDLVLRLKRYGEIRYADDAVVATSARRIAKWGVIRYIFFNATNVAKYNLFHKSYEKYDPVR